jgi:CDP-paratose 2-epimerase
MLVQEYADTYGLKAVIDRCGVIAGPGQFGKVDQGVFTLWVANHHFGKPLRYTGFGATGKQVRDLLHPADLFGLIEKQVAAIDSCSGEVFNVGGGLRGSTSLLELTSTCRQATGREVPLARDPTTSPVDIPSYVTDHALATERFGWEPTRGVGEIVGEIADWLRAEEPSLRPLFGA